MRAVAAPLADRLHRPLLDARLGVTPWSPLKSGALSGKYTRENAGKHKPGRGPFVLSALTDKAYAIVDELIEIAGALDTTPARVALAWVVTRPGVTSTIIGARTLAQLDENLASLEVTLAPDQVAALDALSAPTLDFPAGFLRAAGAFMNGGTTVNGESTPAWPMAPKNESERY